MKKILIFSFVFVLIGLATPTVFAQDTGIAQLSGCTGLDCSACNVVSMANGLIIWLVGILFVVFALLLAIAGVRLVTSGGNHHALDEAKSSFMNAIIGFIIILAAWLIVDTIMRGLVGRPGQEGMIGGEATGWLFWSEIECSDQTDPEWNDVTQEDVEFLGSPCNNPNATAAEIRSAGCNVAPCTAVSCLTSCMNIRQGTDVGQGAGNYCLSVRDLPDAGIPLISQPTGQLCFPSGACFAAVTGIAGQSNYQYPSGFGAPTRWIDTLNPGPGVSMSTRVSANYTLRELNVSGTCGSGGRYMYVDPNALARLEAVNSAAGRRFSLNSVHRSPGCNTRVGGATRSQHMSGKAFDIQPGTFSKAALMQLCRNQGARYVSDYESTSHIHCDWGNQ